MIFHLIFILFSAEYFAENFVLLKQKENTSIGVSKQRREKKGGIRYDGAVREWLSKFKRLLHPMKARNTGKNRKNDFSRSPSCVSFVHGNRECNSNEFSTNDFFFPLTVRYPNLTLPSVLKDL